MTKKATPSRLRHAINKTAGDLRRIGLMDARTHEKITMRHWLKSRRNPRRPRHSGVEPHPGS